MQTLKPDIRQQILTEAEKLFLEQGFSNVSMRHIANKTGIGLSNIYNYFESKDAIFRALTLPAVNALNKMLKEHNGEKYTTIEVFLSPAYQREMINEFLHIITDYRSPFYLLFFCANGSRLQHFKQEILDRNVDTGKAYFQLMKEKYPHLSDDISSHFIRLIAMLWLNAIEELLRIKNISQKETELFLHNYVAYGTAGWKAVLGA